MPPLPCPAANTSTNPVKNASPDTSATANLAISLAPAASLPYFFPMSDRVFVGFGFGPIQAGLFLYEAFRSKQFTRLVVAEVSPDIVAAVRATRGRYAVNIAHADRIEQAEVAGVEMFNSDCPGDRQALIEAVGQAQEMATALPDVRYFDLPGPSAVAGIIADALRSSSGGNRRRILYAGENHNHAAELLTEAVGRRLGPAAADLLPSFSALNTVIGKMSGIVSDEEQIHEQGLARSAGPASRAFLVEAFNRILVSRVPWPDFARGLTMFEEKDDLLPFEEAKLYGHNATHALLGYLAHRKGYRHIADAAGDPGLMRIARDAFLLESGRTLCFRHQTRDPLFTPEGFEKYAEDLLTRMVNPFLRDAVARVIRDPRRKLGWNDRLIGVMRLALQAGIRPYRFAAGAAAALSFLREQEPDLPPHPYETLWPEAAGAFEERRHVAELIEQAAPAMDHLAD